MARSLKNNPVLTTVAIGVGAALIFILMRFVMIPTPVPNTKIQTAYGFLALFAGVFGPLAAAVAAFIGHALNDLLQYGSIWWTWVVGSALLGFSFSLGINRERLAKGVFSTVDAIRFNLVQIIANVVIWGAIAPTLDIFVYQEPENKVYLQGLVSAVANSVSVLIIGTILLVLYAKSRPKENSLYKL